MKKIIILYIFVLFFLNKSIVVEASILALDIWANNLFPILFPTFIMTDLLISSGIIDNIVDHVGKYFYKLFNVNKSAIFVFLVSIISGTPTNAKNLKILYEKGSITKEDINKTLAMSIFFNPLFVISMTSIKIWLIILISNIITGFILKNKIKVTVLNYKKFTYNFSLTDSIKTNIDILFTILGTVTIYSVISSFLPKIKLFNIILSGLLEVTTGLFKLNMIKISIVREIFSVIILSFGGFSIITQIKSILQDLVDVKYLLYSRIITIIVSVSLLLIVNIL